MAPEIPHHIKESQAIRSQSGRPKKCHPFSICAFWACHHPLDRVHARLATTDSHAHPHPHAPRTAIDARRNAPHTQKMAKRYSAMVPVPDSDDQFRAKFRFIKLCIVFISDIDGQTIQIPSGCTSCAMANMLQSTCTKLAFLFCCTVGV